MDLEEVTGNCEIKLDVWRYFMMDFGITGVKSLDPTTKEYQNQQFIKKIFPESIQTHSIYPMHWHKYNSHNPLAADISCA
jgi:hypothetical protein